MYHKKGNFWNINIFLSCKTQMHFFLIPPNFCFVFHILASYDSYLLSKNQTKFLFGLFGETATLTLCWKSSSKKIFEEAAYRTCLNMSNSLTIVKDSYHVIGVFNDLNRKVSFGLDCRNRNQCEKLTTTMYPVCIETNPKGGWNSQDCRYAKDLLIIKKFRFWVKHRFEPLWYHRDYRIRQMEIINVIWEWTLKWGTFICSCNDHHLNLQIFFTKFVCAPIAHIC